MLRRVSSHTRRELKHETEEQLKHFEQSLAQATKLESDQNAAREAQKKIDAAKEKMFGVSAAKQTFETGAAAKLRIELCEVEEKYKYKKISETQWHQTSLALLL